MLRRITALLFLALLTGCPTDGGGDVDPNDVDGDGDPVATDCDDDNPDAFTGNDEVCGDEADNDCDPETVCYAAEVEDQIVYIEPFTGNDHYKTWYRADHPDKPFQESETMLFGLYHRLDTDELFYVVVLDAPDSTPGNVLLVSRGWRGATKMYVDDDPDGLVGDFSPYNREFQFNWTAGNSDGFVVGSGLESDICINTAVTAEDNIDAVGVADPSGVQILGGGRDGTFLCITQ